MAIMKYTAKITLFNSYFDLNKRLSAKSILCILQDVAAVHAEELGVGLDALLSKNLYWVLSRIKFDIIKMPEMNQTVIVETWPHEKGRIDFDRDMRILSEDGNELIIATTKWCVIDTVSRTLQKTENVNYIGGDYLDSTTYEGRFGRLTLPGAEPTECFCHTVSFCDLDPNNHMNNTNYANLVLNAAENKLFSHFEINFISECKENELISVSKIATDDGEFVTATVNGKTAFNAFIK